MRKTERKQDIDLSIFKVDHVPHISDWAGGYLAFRGTENETFFKRYTLARYFVRAVILKKRFGHNESQSAQLSVLKNDSI